MIELQKHVLNQVYPNKELFMKELMKSKKWLQPHEISELKNWLLQRKFHQHQQIVEAVLDNSYQLAS
ncbi:hypothetical protein [Ochrovirga pacifica]|uniref:hypothetical protein n=1 Tax=Ochrovirga pacifica TaxID=1042376 RepID=UPI000255876F|nr:hypothetical protein [Ochrovirga pacifica]